MQVWVEVRARGTGRPKRSRQLGERSKLTRMGEKGSENCGRKLEDEAKSEVFMRGESGEGLGERALPDQEDAKLGWAGTCNQITIIKIVYENVTY